MPLVAFSVQLDKINEALLFQAADGSYWLSCVCVFETDAKGRTIVVQSVSRERYAAGERGPQVGFWREIGAGRTNPPAREGKGFDLAKFKAAATQHKAPRDGKYPQGEEGLFPTTPAASTLQRNPQQEPQADKPHGFEELGF